MARTELPSSVEALRELALEQQAVIDEQAERIAYLEEWKRLIVRARRTHVPIRRWPATL